jgi:hypothetical protein
MSLQIVLFSIAALGLAAGFCGWRASRPWNVLGGPRLVPWSLLMLLAFAGMVLLIGLAAQMAGLKPGSPH